MKVEEAILASMMRWLRQNNEESKPIDKSIYFLSYHFSQQSPLQVQATLKSQQFKTNEKSRGFLFLGTIDPTGIDKRSLSPIYVWFNFNFFHVSRQPPGIVQPLGLGGGDLLEVVLSHGLGKGQIDSNF